MNYIEARVYLDEVSKYGSVLGLESMRELHFMGEQLTMSEYGPFMGVR